MQFIQRTISPERMVRARIEALRQWGWAVLDLLAPPKCVGCGVAGSAWCLDCASKTQRLNEAACALCGNPRTGEVCEHCEAYASVFDRAFSYAYYTDPFRRILLLLKYFNDQGLGMQVARLVLNTVICQAGQIDLLVPVPLGKARRAARGFNQVETFSRPLAALMGTSYAPGALQRSLETRSQVGLGGMERRENLDGAFQAIPDLVAGKRVLLTDDVFTTGATGNACARALKAAGAQAVVVFTLARAPGEKEVQMEIG